jgi:hypothetical protein
MYDARGPLGAGGDGATTRYGGFGHHVAVPGVARSVELRIPSISLSYLYGTYR